MEINAYKGRTVANLNRLWFGNATLTWFKVCTCPWDAFFYVESVMYIRLKNILAPKPNLEIAEIIVNRYRIYFVFGKKNGGKL